MSRAYAVALILLTFTTPAAMAAEILMHDDKSSPESLTVAPDGSVITGSESSPHIYRMRKGAAIVDVFADGSAEGPGTMFLGELADAATDTLWACEVTPVAGITPLIHHSILRGFDLNTGKEKLRWVFPGDNSLCNDFSVGPDKALYITDTAGAKIYRLAPGAQSADLFLEDRLLLGVDGIAFVDGVLYVNNVFFNKLYRIPVDANGIAGTPVDIWMDAPVNGIDGMRTANGKLFAVEGHTGRLDALSITGDTAHITVVKDGLDAPTSVASFGDTLWISERSTGKVISIPLPK